MHYYDELKAFALSLRKNLQCQKFLGRYVLVPACLLVVAGSQLIVGSALANNNGDNENEPGQSINDQLHQAESEQANQLVREAMYHEIYGRNQHGQNCLARAAQLDRDNAMMHWRQGQLYRDGNWRSLSDIAQLAKNDVILRSYRERRDAMRDTEANHLQMADWCARQGLVDQSTVHLLRVLDFNRDNAVARQALGHRNVNGRWFTAQEINQQRIKYVLDQKRVESWKDDLANIAWLANSGSRTSFDRAIRKLKKIKDASAVVPMELILSRQSLALDKELVSHIATIESLEAVDALCRMAVFHPNKSMRDLAAKQLQTRNVFDYVPTMLASMSTPWLSQVDVQANNRGQIVYRHTLFRQGQEENRALQQDRLFQAAQQTRNATAEIADQAQDRIRAEAGLTTMAQASENVRIEQLNRRICAALRLATEEPLGDDPRAWWSWWNDRNEVFYASVKPTDIDRRGRSTVLLNEEQPRSSLPGAMAPESRRHECLVAGTLIETEFGPVAVEDIQLGDRVLTKNINTGELVYKPVIRPTVRPTTILFEIELEDEVVKSSGGHPFWVSGQGWVKARELKSGMPIHTVDGVVTVKSVKENGRAVTYNLVVADNSNYFVGKSRILSHDNSLREATQVVVPGLLEME